MSLFLSLRKALRIKETEIKKCNRNMVPVNQRCTCAHLGNLYSCGAVVHFIISLNLFFFTLCLAFCETVSQHHVVTWLDGCVDPPGAAQSQIHSCTFSPSIGVHKFPPEHWCRRAPRWGNRFNSKWMEVCVCLCVCVRFCVRGKEEESRCGEIIAHRSDSSLNDLPTHRVTLMIPNACFKTDWPIQSHRPLLRRVRWWRWRWAFKKTRVLYR